MPTSSQGTIAALPGGEYGTGTRSKGSSDSASLAKAYPNSPINLRGEDMTACSIQRGDGDGTLKGWYQANVLDGVEENNTGTGTVDMNYGTSDDTAADLQPPDLEADLTDTEGTAVNSYVPDVSAEAATGVYPGSDRVAPIPTSPSATSITMSKQDISNLPIKGKSEVPVETSSS